MSFINSTVPIDPEYSVPSQIPATNIQAILANPQLVQRLQSQGVDPYAYADQLAQQQSALAYSQHMMDVLAGLTSGGGGGSNPVLDDLARQGINNDRSYLQTLMDLAGKKSGLTADQYKAQLDQLQNQSVANNYAKQLLGIQGANTKLDLSRLGLKDADVADTITKLGYQMQSLGFDAQDIRGAIQSLGLDKAQLGNALTRLGLQRQDIGVQRAQALTQHDSTQRQLTSDATARGAVNSEGFKSGLSTNDTQYQQAIQRLGLSEQGIGTQESDIGLQGQQLDIQGNKLQNDLSRNALAQQGTQTDIGTANRQYQYTNLDRQQVMNALQGLGIQTDQLNLKDSDIALARRLLGLQNQADIYQQYGDIAQLNNQLTALDLKEQGIGQSAGGGGADNSGTILALQAGAQANQLAGNINSLTGAFGRQALGALSATTPPVTGGFGSAAGPLGSLTNPSYNPFQNGTYVNTGSNPYYGDINSSPGFTTSYHNQLAGRAPLS